MNLETSSQPPQRYSDRFYDFCERIFVNGESWNVVETGADRKHTVIAQNVTVQDDSVASL